MKRIRKFALVVVDDFGNEIPGGRFNLDFADTPRNLGFELEFTTLESRLTTYFTSAREKKLPVTLNLNFLRPNAYEKANAFKRFVQKYTNQRMVFEYNDTTSEIKNWEGKIQKMGLEELNEFGSLVCPISFIPSTPKYIKKDNVLSIGFSTDGKSYPTKYPYTYGKGIIENNVIENTYFDEIPLRVTLYGYMTNPQITLVDSETNDAYSIVRFENLVINKDVELIIDAINSKVLIGANGNYVSAYDYISKQQNLDSFLYAKGNTTSKLLVSLKPSETGYSRASYRQYTL